MPDTRYFSAALATAVTMEAGKDEPLSPLPDAAPVRRSLEADAMEKAAASIVTAVAKAAKKGAKDSDA